MDTSQQYIKMCQEAHEIQDGELIDLHDKETFYHCIYEDSNLPTCIWLPRQDQLQDILFRGKEYLNGNVSIIINNIYAFSRREEFEPYGQENGLLTSNLIKLKSMEAFMLFFIMKEKFNKEWDFKNETWIDAR